MHLAVMTLREAASANVCFPPIADVRPSAHAPSFSLGDAMGNFFGKFTTGCARFAGQPAMLFVCLLLAGTGIVAFFTGNELFISGANISISIVTLLLLPILQATQNRDGAALQAKIDELIKADNKARDDLIGLENRDEAEIERMRIDEGQRAKASKRGRNRKSPR